MSPLSCVCDCVNCASGNHEGCYCEFKCRTTHTDAEFDGETLRHLADWIQHACTNLKGEYAPIDSDTLRRIAEALVEREKYTEHLEAIRESLSSKNHEFATELADCWEAELIRLCGDEGEAGGDPIKAVQSLRADHDYEHERVEQLLSSLTAEKCRVQLLSTACKEASRQLEESRKIEQSLRDERLQLITRVSERDSDIAGWLKLKRDMLQQAQQLQTQLDEANRCWNGSMEAQAQLGAELKESWEHAQYLRIENQQLRDLMARALRETGCDGDLCAYEWHEEARRLLQVEE